MERPILFNTEMVRAILEGWKTQTRRIVKPQILDDGTWGYSAFTPEKHISFRKKEGSEWFIKLPYCIGDILYVRETFWKGDLIDENGSIIESDLVLYKADEPNVPSWGTEEYLNYKWSPSIHMPKAVARIFLRVANVRVERLQDITEEGAEKEGIGNLFVDEISYSDNPKYLGPMERETINIEQFELLWNSTIKKKELEQYGWDSNPWVWVIEFEKLEGAE